MPPPALTVTVTDSLVLPPAPSQLNVKVEVLLSAAVAWLPAVVLLPLQSPEALQLEALVDDQVSIEVSLTLTVVGSALSETVGAGGVALTVTVALFCALPPAPEQLSV